VGLARLTHFYGRVCPVRRVAGGRGGGDETHIPRALIDFGRVFRQHGTPKLTRGRFELPVIKESPMLLNAECEAL